MVLRKEPKGARVLSGKDSMPDIASLALASVEEHCGLVTQ